MTPKAEDLYDWREDNLTPQTARPFPDRENGYAAEEEVQQIVLDVSDYENRLKGLTGRDYRTIGSNPDTQFKFIARFMTDGRGHYLTEEEAIEALDELEWDEIGDVFQQLQEALQAAVVPKKSGRPSRRVRISK